MTTSQLNAEVLRNLSILAESEEMFERAAKYLRKLVKEQQQQADSTLMSKEEFFGNWIRRRKILHREREEHLQTKMT